MSRYGREGGNKACKRKKEYNAFGNRLLPARRQVPHLHITTQLLFNYSQSCFIHDQATEVSGCLRLNAESTPASIRQRKSHLTFAVLWDKAYWECIALSCEAEWQLVQALCSFCELAGAENNAESLGVGNTAMLAMLIGNCCAKDLYLSISTARMVAVAFYCNKQ